MKHHQKIRENDQIHDNIEIHDKIFSKYEKRHSEIFNPIEQERLANSLKEAVNCICTDSEKKVALDYGCGTGNVTRHLINLGLHVVSTDVSEKFLEIVKLRFSKTNQSEALKINGKDLSNIESNKFDIVTTYSVLHHVPDYLEIIREFIRVTKRGGIIYIDHEVNENFWNKPTEYVGFLELIKTKKTYSKFINPKKYLNKFRRMINPHYCYEGDIHILPDDHIEWIEIEKILTKKNCEIVFKRDYLLYRGYNLDVYYKCKDKCSDMRVIVARKAPFGCKSVVTLAKHWVVPIG